MASAFAAVRSSGMSVLLHLRGILSCSLLASMCRPIAGVLSWLRSRVSLTSVARHPLVRHEVAGIRGSWRPTGRRQLAFACIVIDEDSHEGRTPPATFTSSPVSLIDRGPIDVFERDHE